MKILRFFFLLLPFLFIIACSSEDDLSTGTGGDTGGDAKTSCAVTGSVNYISYCSAHLQASYHIPEDVTLPDNYNWAKDASLGICYAKSKDVANDNSSKVYFLKNGEAQNTDNWYDAGYAYDNDTTYYKVVVDYLDANATYYYCTFFCYYGKTYYGEVKSFKTQPLNQAVDLGLSVKWAAYNVGASSPEEKGGYYAWGETETKSDYSSSNYSYRQNYDYVDIGSEISDTQYDVAHVKWGGNWRMPTKTEMEELINSCTWQYTLCNGVKGALVIGSNNNSIFLPYTGSMGGTTTYYDDTIGEYWTSSIGKEYTYSSSNPWVLFYNGSFYSTFYSKLTTDGVRYSGQCVRPVCD